SSAQAQKFTPNPSVTSRSARQAPCGTVVVDGAVCAAGDVVIGWFSTLGGRCAVEDGSTAQCGSLSCTTQGSSAAETTLGDFGPGMRAFRGMRATPRQNVLPRGRRNCTT